MPKPPRKKVDPSRDLDHDGDVDLADDPSLDLDHDGVIDSADRRQQDLDHDNDIDSTDHALAAKNSVGAALGIAKAGQGSASQSQQQSTAPKVK